MTYKVIPTSRFKEQAKRFIRKFPSLRNELADFEKSLADDPLQGTSLGNNTYKIRLAVRSKGKGKSGGMRVITYLLTKQREIYLLTIYDKSELANVTDKDLKTLIKDLLRG